MLSLVVVLVVAVLVAVLVVARVVAVVLVVVLAIALVAVLVLCVVLYRERNGSTIYVKKIPTVLFLVKDIAKLQRERCVCWPGPFPEDTGPQYDPGESERKNP